MMLISDEFCAAFQYGIYTNIMVFINMCCSLQIQQEPLGEGCRLPVLMCSQQNEGTEWG